MILGKPEYLFSLYLKSSDLAPATDAMKTLTKHCR
jgi:hypothetical protein